MIITNKGCHAFTYCGHPECEAERKSFWEAAKRLQRVVATGSADIRIRIPKRSQ